MTKDHGRVIRNQEQFKPWKNIKGVCGALALFVLNFGRSREPEMGLV